MTDQSDLIHRFQLASEIISFRTGYASPIAYRLSMLSPEFGTTIKQPGYTIDVDSICISPYGTRNTVIVNKDWYDENCIGASTLAVWLLHAIVKDSLLWVIPIITASLSIQRAGSWSATANISNFTDSSNELAFNEYYSKDGRRYNGFSKMVSLLEDPIVVPSSTVDEVEESSEPSPEPTTQGDPPKNSSIRETDKEIINFSLDMLTSRIVKGILSSATKTYHKYFRKETYPESILRKSMPLHPIVRMFMIAFGASGSGIRAYSNTFYKGGKYCHSSVLPAITYEDMAIALDTMRENSKKSTDIRFACTYIGCMLAFTDWRLTNPWNRITISSDSLSKKYDTAYDVAKAMDTVVKKLSTPTAKTIWKELNEELIKTITIPEWTSPKTAGINVRKISISEKTGWTEELLDATSSRSYLEAATEIIEGATGAMSSEALNSSAAGFCMDMVRSLAKVAAQYNEEVEDTFTHAINKISQCKNIISRIIGHPQHYIGVIPTADRRAAYSLLAGIYPIFFDNTSTSRDNDSGEVAVYIDVSGSMGDNVNTIYSICAGLSEYLSNHIYLYSNKVEHITLKELKSGKIETTYGTDFDCVMNHMATLPHDIRKMVIFTDGFWGWKDDSLNRLQAHNNSIELFFICTSDAITKNIERLPFKTNVIMIKE